MATMTRAGTTMLLERLDEAVVGCETRYRAAAVGATLQKLVRTGRLDGLTDELLALPPPGDTYARHALHTRPDGTVSVLAMVWGPGHGTPLHDHGGLWGVECILTGALEIVPHEPRERRGALWNFHRCRPQRARAGFVDRFDPRGEYHVVRNPSVSETTVTLHVYGGVLDRCSVFDPVGDGWYTRRVAVLTTE